MDLIEPTKPKFRHTIVTPSGTKINIDTRRGIIEVVTPSGKRIHREPLGFQREVIGIPEKPELGIEPTIERPNIIQISKGSPLTVLRKYGESICNVEFDEKTGKIRIQCRGKREELEKIVEELRKIL